MELTIDKALQKGIEAHKAGKVQEADRYYTAILKAQPKHPDANHNMGVLAVGLGKVEEALPFFKTALEANPNIAQFWLSYIDALIKLDKIDEAKAILDQVKSKGFNDKIFDQLCQRLYLTDEIIDAAIELRESGEYRKAIKALKSYVKAFPKEASLFAHLSHCYILINDLKYAAFYLDKAKEIDSKLALVGWNQARLLLKQKKAVEALAVARKTYKLAPDDVEGMGILGSCLRVNGDIDEGLKFLDKAIKLKPNYSEALINRGLIRLAQKDKTKALLDLEKAYQFKPHIKQIWNTLLNLIIEIKQFKKAIKISKKMVEIDPGDEQILATIGFCYQKLKDLDQAIDFYTKAISIKPDYFEAYSNLGAAFKDKDMFEDAVASYKKALSIKPGSREAYNNLGNLLKGIAFKKPDPDLQKFLSVMFDNQTDVRPSDIFNAAISLLRFEPILKKQLCLHHAEQEIQNPYRLIKNLSKLPLLLKMMSVCPVSDLEFEKLFTKLRAHLLLNLSSFKASPEVLKFQSALALQCFTNEYIYSQNNLECQKIEELEKSVRESFTVNKQPRPEVILTLASYKALHKYEWCQSIVINDELRTVFIRQVEEPQQEEKLKSEILLLDGITNKVSEKVRDQYEKNPYPRWVNLGLPSRPVPVSKMIERLKLKCITHNLRDTDEPNILIAGCGTGQDAIGAASRFKNSKVLAVDLSLSSLAYAKRKTQEIRIHNIEYMHADILDLHKLNRKFDIIESVGVLHHMEDPMAGWRVLADCLMSGGLMRIGLYSDLARRDIVKIRREISESGIVPSEENIKSFRNKMVYSDKEHHKNICNFYDFYTMSEIRDLLFHVKEHRFRIPQLIKCLSELGLKFCGFENEKIVSHFKQTYSNGDCYDLDDWHVYELNYPGAFSGMYEFWCQKES